MAVVCSNSTWKHEALTATFGQPSDLFPVTNTAWQNEKAAGVTSGDLCPIWLPTMDTLRNLFQAPTVDMKITFELMMGRLDRVTDFEDYLAALRVEYKRKRNFIKLLERFETS
jgi:hypothetical protein